MIKHEQSHEKGHLQNVQSFETCIETGHLQSYDEQSIKYKFTQSSSQSGNSLITSECSLEICKEKQVNQRYSAWTKGRLSPLKLQLSNLHMGVSINLAIK